MCHIHILWTLMLSLSSKPGQVCALTSLGQDAEIYSTFLQNRQPSSCWDSVRFLYDCLICRLILLRPAVYAVMPLIYSLLWYHQESCWWSLSCSITVTPWKIWLELYPDAILANCFTVCRDRHTAWNLSSHETRHECVQEKIHDCWTINLPVYKN